MVVECGDPAICEAVARQMRQFVRVASNGTIVLGMLYGLGAIARTWLRRRRRNNNPDTK